MRVSVTEAEGQLAELVRRAEAGEEVILTRQGEPAVSLTPVQPKQDAALPEQRRRVLDDLVGSARDKAIPGVSAARSQDFLYDDDGLPG